MWLLGDGERTRSVSDREDVCIHVQLMKSVTFNVHNAMHFKVKLNVHHNMMEFILTLNLYCLLVINDLCSLFP